MEILTQYRKRSLRYRTIGKGIVCRRCKVEKINTVEHKKIYGRRITQVALIAVLLLSGLLSFSTYQNQYCFDGQHQACGGEAVKLDKAIAAKYEGLLTDEKVRQMLAELVPVAKILAFVMYGKEALACSILFASVTFTEGYIPFNLTCRALLAYQILLAFTGGIRGTGITLVISAVSKHQMTAFAVSAAVYLLPVFLPVALVFLVCGCAASHKIFAAHQIV
ncbi:hypothetical protein [Parablautia muri]|uniref:hypothetical protein n=1 Tax=Parablautia muri TaxID=2320879 RepID=UPI0024123F54|nr:hypothetical protein [Parablautia muri]